MMLNHAESFSNLLLLCKKLAKNDFPKAVERREDFERPF